MYLLLRNNKQTGPYSLEELKTMGLKAYDLVWIEGKSAAWRYPCEIDELSAFAPAVEEQPFDRFYKKTTSPVKANANSSAVVAEPVRSIAEPVRSLETPITSPPSTPVYGGEPSTIAGKRIIYVTMPAGKGPVSTPARETRDNREIPPREPAPREIPIREIPATPAAIPHQSVAPATAPTYFPENNYAQSSPEDAPIEEFLPRRQRRSSSRVVRPLVVSLTVLAVLAAGIFIGLSINKDSLGFKHKIASNNAHSQTPVNAQPSHAAPQVQTPMVQHDATPVITGPQSTIPSTTIDKAASAPKPAATEKPSGQPVTRPQKAATQTREKVAAPRTSVATAPAVKDSSAGGSTAHREAAHRTGTDDYDHDRTGNTDQAATARTTIASQVSASANGYSVGTFGGISGLQVTVSNHSAYPLDLVVVEVQYVQSNKKIYKTENLYFRGIGAGSALMQEAPKSSRGIRVQYKITMINSKELGLSYSGI